DHLGDALGKRRSGGPVGPESLPAGGEAGGKLICSGKDAGAVVPGALIVRAEFAKQEPQNVAKYLAIYIRAQQWAVAHRKEAIAVMRKFYDQGGVSISETSMNKEFDTRPVY